MDPVREGISDYDGGYPRMVRSVAVLCLVSAALAVSASGSAGAAGAATETTLKVTYWENPARSSTRKVWTLRCTPAGGTLPRPAVACRRLGAIGAKLFAPVPRVQITEDGADRVSAQARRASAPIAPRRRHATAGRGSVPPAGVQRSVHTLRVDDLLSVVSVAAPAAPAEPDAEIETAESTLTRHRAQYSRPEGTHIVPEIPLYQIHPPLDSPRVPERQANRDHRRRRFHRSSTGSRGRSVDANEIVAVDNLPSVRLARRNEPRRPPELRLRPW